MITHYTSTVDPLDNYSLAPPTRLIESCGILPQWAMSEVKPTMKDSLIESYPFYFAPMEGGTVSDEGVYQYPEDEPLYPIFKILKFEDDIPVEVCFMYQYAIVACVDQITGKQWVTRMD